MPLPKIATPTYELELPSTGKSIKYRPFLVKEEKVLVIALESEDTKQITNAIKAVLKNCVLTKGIKVETLPTFDIEFLFLNIRGKSVGEEVEVNLIAPDDEVTQVPVTIDIDDIKISPGGDVTLPLISGYSDEFDLGEATFGESSSILFDFHNIGVSDLHITNVYFNPAEAFNIGPETIFPHTTAPNDSNGFYIVFEPTSNENNIYFTEMTIESNMVADIQISLTGIGRSNDMQVYDRIVFIEDFTAAEWCPYCPVGSFAVRDLIDDNPDEIISIFLDSSSF